MKVETVNAQTPIQAPDPAQPLSNAYAWPDAQGRFGPYGGQFVAETLMAPLAELEAAYRACQADPAFLAEFDHDLAHFVGRPSPLYHAERWSREFLTQLLAKVGDCFTPTR